MEIKREPRIATYKAGGLLVFGGLLNLESIVVAFPTCKQIKTSGEELHFVWYLCKVMMTLLPYATALDPAILLR